MPLIISTIMPQARMPVCAVSSRTTAALAGRVKVSGSRTVITAIRASDQHDQQQPSVGGDAGEHARADGLDRLVAGVDLPAGATSLLIAASGHSRALGAASSRMAISVAVAASSSPATRPSDMTTMRCARARTSGRSEETTSSAMPFAARSRRMRVDVGLGADVDAAGRLVHDQDARLARQPFGEQHLLLVAARQVAHLAVDARRGDAQILDIALADLRASRPPTGGPRACRWAGWRRPRWR